MSFWNTLIETNTFNFIILVIIFAIVINKINLSGIIDKIKNNIIQEINNAELEKETSAKKLKYAQQQYDSLENDLKNNSYETEQKADTIRKHIIKNAQENISAIENNAKLLILSEEKTLNSKFIENTLKSATSRAEDLIIEKLKNNPELHYKFIEESIGEL